MLSSQRNVPLLDQYRPGAVPWGTMPLDWRQVGTHIGVYMFWRGPKLLYIGSSGDMMMRLMYHFYTRKEPRRRPTAVSILKYTSLREARTRERELIRKLHPHENIRR